MIRPIERARCGTASHQQGGGQQKGNLSNGLNTMADGKLLTIKALWNADQSIVPSFDAVLRSSSNQGGDSHHFSPSH
jgi:hypothetical protein